MSAGPPSFLLRVLGPDDSDLVAGLEREVFPADPWTAGMVDEELRAPGRHYVAAETPRGEVLGYAGVSLGPDADVMTIGVRRAARGRGVGRVLLEDLLAAARAAGARRVFLEVRPSNEAARRLYSSAGFHEVGRVRRYFRHPTEDALTMRTDLAPVSAGTDGTDAADGAAGTDAAGTAGAPGAGGAAGTDGALE